MLRKTTPCLLMPVHSAFIGIGMKVRKFNSFGHTIKPTARLYQTLWSGNSGSNF